MSTIIGLTGPTGSGKTTVSAFMERHGIHSINCDEVAHQVISPGKPAFQELVGAFGSGILGADGGICRHKLADFAFATSDATQKLNSITHPQILKAIQDRIDELRATGVRGILLDAPTLYESGADALCDRVIAILAAPDERHKRVVCRDGIAEDAVCLRMGAQQPDSFYTERADDIIYNNGDLDSLKMRLTEMFHEYIRIFQWKI